MGVPATPENLMLRLAVEHFLFEEVALLDAWRLEEWLALFTEDCLYVVPTTDLPDGDPKRDLVFIDDNLVRLRGRVTRLLSRYAHREYPFSRTRRMITNVRLTRIDEKEVDLEASFAVYRSRNEVLAHTSYDEDDREREDEWAFLPRVGPPPPPDALRAGAEDNSWRTSTPVVRFLLRCSLLCPRAA